MIEFHFTFLPSNINIYLIEEFKDLGGEREVEQAEVDRSQAEVMMHAYAGIAGGDRGAATGRCE